jgi:thiamine pyrophosphate-dependent acetolactate synthase large subunit-like protein
VAPRGEDDNRGDGAMAELTGNEILARCLKAQGVRDLFFIMGGPMLDAELACIKEGIRLIDTRHEQGAAYMAQAYSRVTQGPGVCMAASGPATLNFSTGLANALIDCCPVVALGGSSPISQFGRQVFQEIDQVKALEGCVKYADRVHNLKRLPQQLNFSFQKALNGKPGPVYLDFPGDVLYLTVDEAQVDWSYLGRPIIRARPYAEPRALNALVDALRKAQRPIIVSGSGVLWSQAWDEMRSFVEQAGIPFYTTPQGRGVVPDDHPYSYLTMRNDAFREADLVLILGTRTNYVIGHALPPRFSAEAKVARIDIDPEEMGLSARNIDIPVVGDCKSVLQQLLEAVDARTADRFQPWRQKLADGEAKKRLRAGGNYPTDGDIHPLRLCEEIKNFMQREAILCVDGQEILNYGRQSIPTFVPGHRLNSGPFGTMGVGLPFAVGAKAAKPGAQVICLHGDGSFGQNAMELDTAVRHKLPLLCVISLNGGWTADPERNKPGRDLGYTRYDKMAEALGCYAEYVEEPEEIRPALLRAWRKVEEGMVGFVNVKTDYRARATTVRFSSRET